MMMMMQMSLRMERSTIVCGWSNLTFKSNHYEKCDAMRCVVMLLIAVLCCVQSYRGVTNQNRFDRWFVETVVFFPFKPGER